MFHVKHHPWFGIRLSDGAHRYVLLNSGNLDSLYHSPHTLLDEGQVSTAMSLLAHFPPIIEWLRHPIGKQRIHDGYCSQYACNMRPGKMTPTQPPTNADEFGNRQQVATARRYRRSHQHHQYQACSYRPTQAVSKPLMMSFPIDPVQVIQYQDFRHLNECGSNRRNIYSHRSASQLMFHVKHQTRRLIRTILDVSPHLTEM